MMNKQSIGKAWRWKVATFLPLLALLLIFCSRKSNEEYAGNSFRFDNQQLNLDHCFILFETKPQPHRFELNLVGGNVDTTYNFDDSTKVKQLVWLSLIPKDRFWLEDGEYKFSPLSPASSPQMSFSGKVRIGSKEVNITGGDLVCKHDSGNINITFNLEVEKKDKIKGSYAGRFNKVSRVIENLSSLGNAEAKTKIISTDKKLSIVFKMDGNYINDQLYAYDDFIAKLNEWKKADPKSRGVLSFRFDQHVMESEARNREITAISRAAHFPFVLHLNLDQQAIFPGGMEGMFDWVKRNINYPEGEKSFLTRRDVGVQFEVNENGKVINPKVTGSVNPALDAEALRVVSQMPAWKPAIKNGVPVSVTESIAVPFYPPK